MDYLQQFSVDVAGVEGDMSAWAVLSLRRPQMTGRLVRWTCHMEMPMRCFLVEIKATSLHFVVTFWPVFKCGYPGTKSWCFILNSFMPGKDCVNYFIDKVFSSLRGRSKNVESICITFRTQKTYSLRNCCVSASEIRGEQFTLNRFRRRGVFCLYECVYGMGN